MYQQITLIGHLGKDPEMRFSQKQLIAVANFDMAVRQPGKDDPIWVRVYCWDKVAEAVTQNLRKGSIVHVTGTLFPDKETNGPRTYNRKGDGLTVGIYEVTARVVTFLSKKKDGSGEWEQNRFSEDDEDVLF